MFRNLLQPREFRANAPVLRHCEIAGVVCSSVVAGGLARVSRGLSKLGVHRVHRVVCFSCNATRTFWLEGGAGKRPAARWTALHCAALLCAALRCAALRCAALHCAGLRWCCSASFFVVLYFLLGVPTTLKRKF